MLSKITYILLFVCFVFQAFPQNTLDVLGLESNRPGAAVYSLRQLSSGYTGPAVKVRRALDNAEATVQFNSTYSPAYLDGASNATFTEGAILTQALGTLRTGTISTHSSKTGTITIAVNKTGTITTSNTSTTVTGVGTSFTTQLVAGDLLYTTTNVFLGVVRSITNNTTLVLNNTATISQSAIAYKSNRAQVTGSGTLFTTELAVGDRLFNASNTYLGTVISIANNTSCFVNAIDASAVSSITYGNTSTTVTGSGTAFTTELNVGDLIVSNNVTLGIVASIASATSLTLTTKAGGSVSNGAFRSTAGTIPFSTFYATTNVYVSTWYDQSGLNRHAIQQLANHQPKIVNTGALYIVNGKVTIEFSPSLTSFLHTTQAASFMNGTNFIVNKVSAEANMNVPTPSYVLSTTGGLGPNNTILSFGYKNASQLVMNQYNNEHVYNSNASPQLEVHSIIKFSANGSRFYKNGNFIGSTSASSSSISNAGLLHIGYYTPSASYFNGYVFELLIFSTWTNDTYVSSFSNDQKTYYNITEANWTGGVSSDWNNANNWQPAVVPNATEPSFAVIPNDRPRYPIIPNGTTASAVSIYIEPNASVTVEAGGKMQVAANIVNTGTFNATAGTIEYIGVSSQTIANNTFLNNTIGSLLISNSNNAPVMLGGNLSIANNLEFNANAGTGKLDLGSSSLTLQGNIINPGTSIIGSPNASLLFTGIGSISFGLDQSIPGTSNALQNLTIHRNSEIISSNSDIVIVPSGSLTFSNGKLAIGANTLSIGGTITNTVHEGIRGSSSSSILVNGSTNNTLSFDQTTPGTTNALHTLTISTTNSNTTSMYGNISIENTLQVDAIQTLNLSSYALAGTLSTITNNGTITTQNTSALPIPSGKTWGGLVHYNGSSSQKAVAGTYHNLTISNTAGATATGDITVNGILDLPVANPNATNGVLEMTNNYGDYSNILTATEDLITTWAQSHDFLDSYILYMGNGAVHAGQGDVTGKVKRTTIVPNVEYTFGSPFSSIMFSSAGTAPSEVMFIITKGPNRGIHANKTNTVERLYQVIRTGGASPNKFTLKMRYLDTELNGNTKSELVTWDHHIPYSSTNTPHQHGRTALNQTENWVSIAGHGIGYLEQTQNIGDRCKYWMIHPPSIPLSDYVWEAASAVYISKWDEPANWSTGLVPTATSNVLIPASKAHYPILEDNTSYEVKTITIENGASLTLGDNTTFTVQGGPADNGGIGSWSNQGSFTAGTSTVIFNFEEATIDGATAFHNLTINSSKVVTLQSGSVTQIGGTFTNNGTYNAGFFTNTVEYNGAGNQSVINPNGDIPKYYNLILSGSGTKTIAAAGDIEIIGDFQVSNTAIANFSNDITIGGNITIDAGATLLTNSHSFYILGNILFNGIADAGSTSRVEMIGTQNQTISGTSTPQFYTIEIDNSQNVSLLTDIIVHNELQLTNGNLQVQSQTLGINGNIIGSSYIEVTPNSSLTFGGNSNQTIPDNVFSDEPIISNLTISNAAGVIPGNQPFTIEGTLALDEGEFTIDSKTLTIEGTITRNTGTIGLNSSTQLYFSENSNPLTIPNSLFADTQLGILGINRSGGVILGNQALTITDKLLLTNGKFTCGSNIIQFPAGAQVGYDVDEYGNILEINHLFPEIVTSYIHGCATKVGAEPFIFPIGSNSKYSPIGISDSPGGDATTSFTACYYQESPNDLYTITSLDEELHHVSSMEYWTLSKSNGSNAVSVTLYWWNDRSGGVSLLENLRVARWDGTKWESKGNEGISGNFQAGSVSSEFITDFSPYTLGSTTLDNPLPVTLTQFSANCNTQNQTIDIVWQTASETNNDFFTIEKLRNDNVWETVAIVKGVGTTSNYTEYEFQDNSSIGENSLIYRLKQTDYNGIYSFSNIIYSYGCSELSQNVIVYPNPAKDVVNIDYFSKNQRNIAIEITDIEGKLLIKESHKATKGKNTFTIPLHNSIPGTYYLSVEDNNKKFQKQFIKK